MTEGSENTDGVELHPRHFFCNTGTEPLDFGASSTNPEDSGFDNTGLVFYNP